MSFFALSQLLALGVAASGAFGAFSPPRFAMTAWDKAGFSAGVRLYGSTLDRSGILELSLNGKLNSTSAVSFPWNVDFHLVGTAVTAIGSDFAAISTKDGTKLVVFFIRNNGALSYVHSPNAMVPTWSLGLVGGSPKPVSSTSLGAAMWGPDHMSVFYQDVEGIIFESEFKNGTWAAPADITAANVGTDIHAVAGTDNAKAPAKFVYVQSARRLEEWRYPLSTSEWTGRPIDAFPPQNFTANVRFSIQYYSYIQFSSIYDTTSAGSVGEIRGSPGRTWSSNGTIPGANNRANSDIANVFQPTSSLELIVYTAPDGTLQQQVFDGAQGGAGWGSPSQIAPSPDKVQVKGTI